MGSSHSFTTSFTEGYNLCDFLFASSDNKAHPVSDLHILLPQKYKRWGQITSSNNIKYSPMVSYVSYCYIYVTVLYELVMFILNKKKYSLMDLPMREKMDLLLREGTCSYRTDSFLEESNPSGREANMQMAKLSAQKVLHSPE